MRFVYSLILGGIGLFGGWVIYLSTDNRSRD